MDEEAPGKERAFEMRMRNENEREQTLASRVFALFPSRSRSRFPSLSTAELASSAAASSPSSPRPAPSCRSPRSLIPIPSHLHSPPPPPPPPPSLLLEKPHGSAQGETARGLDFLRSRWASLILGESSDAPAPCPTTEAGRPRRSRRWGEATLCFRSVACLPSSPRCPTSCIPGREPMRETRVSVVCVVLSLCCRA